MQRKDATAAPRETATAVPLDVKALTEDGQFEGYGSTFGNVDQGGDMVKAGAFAMSLQRRPASRVKMLWQHDPEKIIGRWMEMREDDRGLWCKGQLFVDMERGREAYEYMRRGVLDGLSIGFRTVEDTWNSANKVRELNELDLREVSLVTFPMNEAASVTLVKGDKLPTEREFERWLVRDAGFSARQAKGIIAHGYRHLAERDAGTGDDEGLVEAIKRLTNTLRR